MLQTCQVLSVSVNAETRPVICSVFTVLFAVLTVVLTVVLTEC